MKLLSDTDGYTKSLTVQKQEKPKFVLCVTFSENGDTITGDSSGNILVWGKGERTSL